MSVKYAARLVIACLVFVVGISDKDREELLLVGFGPARPKRAEDLDLLSMVLGKRRRQDFAGVKRRKLCAAMILAITHWN